MPGAIHYRTLSSADAEAMAECHLADNFLGPADPRMGAYFDGRHHPQRALGPRTGFGAFVYDAMAGYIAGHLSTRFDCQGEVQYLFVAPAHRRLGVAATLLRHMADWFEQHDARRICVNVNLESPGAEDFYRGTGATPLSESKPFWYIWEDIGRAPGR